jgi:phosphoserine/homoserine phosphotransferase
MDPIWDRSRPRQSVWSAPRHRHQRDGPAMKPSTTVRQSIVALDMEGVLTPEIWIAVADHAGIPELRRTTRDEPDYDALMRRRLTILDRHGLRLSDIQAVIGTLPTLDGAREFLDDLRALTPVLILSDTFEQFAAPLMRKLNWPTLLCHRLVVEDDHIVDYRLRVREQKLKTVVALKQLNYHVVAVGDSFNDTAMLEAAHVGFLFRAPRTLREHFTHLVAVDTYADLMTSIEDAMTRDPLTDPGERGRHTAHRRRVVAARLPAIGGSFRPDLDDTSPVPDKVSTAQARTRRGADARAVG